MHHPDDALQAAVRRPTSTGGSATAVADVSVPSRLLGADIRVAAIPPPPRTHGRELPWLYLLHGHRGTIEAMRPVLEALAKAMDDGRLRRHVVVAPDAPWCGRAGWWVDSAYAGGGPGRSPGAAIESAMLTELRPSLEDTWGAPTDRTARLVGGISMGGAGALRWALVHPELFGTAVLLSPATYAASPPTGSSVYTSTAFGTGRTAYEPRRYAELCHYPSLLARRGETAPPLRVVTVTGDAEPAQAGPDGWADLDLEAGRLHAALKRAANVESSLRIVGGGHSWDLWAREVVDAVRLATRESERQPGTG